MLIITNHTTKLLQITSALLITNYHSFFITNYDKVLTNWDRDYKSRQNYYNLRHHYKLRQLLIAELHERASIAPTHTKENVVIYPSEKFW